MTRRLLSAFFLFTLVTAAVVAEPPKDWLYKDTVHFQQLSPAARFLLMRRFLHIPDGFQFSLVPAPETATTNVNVNNPAFDTTAQDTQSTSALVLGSGSNVVGAFTDTGSFTGSNNHYTGFARSSNSGTSFTDNGALPASTEGDGGDAVLAVDQTSGNIYLATLGFVLNENIQVFRSLNNGTTFGAPVNGTPGFAGTADFQDKPWITVDNFAGTGQGNVYLVWRRFPFTGNGDIRITRSTDGGLTFGPSQGVVVYTLTTATDNAQGAYVTVAPDHSIYVFWFDVTSGVRNIKMKKSTDQGATFGTAVNVTSIVSTGVNGNLGLNGGFNTNCFPQAAVNPVNSDVYAVYNDDPSGVDKANVFLRRSTDGGTTWSAATLVNSDGTQLDQFHPSLAVTPDGTHVFVSWYDRRDDASNLLIHRYGKIYTVDGSGNLTAAGEFRISTQSFPPVVNQDPAAPAGYMSDYDQSTADNSFFYTSWGDNRHGDVAHSHEPDVIFAQVSVNGPGALLQFNGSTIDDSGGNGSGAVDPNECVSMNVSLKNFGTSTATAVSATLTALSSGITVNQPSSAYADIAPGGSATATTPFEFQTSPSYLCGGRIDFQLTITTGADGTFQVPFTIFTGLPGSTVRGDNNTVSVIPDLGMLEAPIAVAGIATGVNNIKVSFHIEHTRDSDLSIYLVAPDNSTVELSTANGGAGANYGTACNPDTTRTTLDDASASAISLAAAPFAGTFKPEGHLSDYAGKSGGTVNGTWKLRVLDTASGDVGVLDCWSIFVSPAACAPGTGGCSCPTITISPPTLPDGTIGVPYSQTLVASGSPGPFTFQLASGTLPPGLGLDSSGNLTGTPTTGGVFNFTVTATDPADCVGSQSYTISIACPTITISPATLPDGTLGQPYTQNLSSSGGTAPYTYAVTSGALPTGLSLSSSGLISGTPSASGTYNFTVTSTDQFGCTGTQAYTVSVGCGAIDVQPATLPDGHVNISYNQTIMASGGNAPYTFAVTGGSLPPGLTLNTNGNLSGTPTTSGSFSFTITATDAINCAGSRDYTINVVNCPVIDIQPATLPDGNLNVAYDQTITASGGAAPYSFAVTSGSLPPGLTLNSTGNLSGTPTLAGSFSFTVTATDTDNCTGTRDYTVNIVACPVITLSPATLPDGDTNTAYDQTVTASGGAGPYTFAVTAGALPPGLSLAADGHLTGTPTSSGAFSFTITATDANTCTGTQDYTINVTSCLFCDDFEDGVLAMDWTYQQPSWSEAGGSLIGVPVKKKAIAIAAPVFGGCSDCTMEATFRTAGGSGNRVSMFGWYVDKKNTLELLMKEQNNVWILKQKSGGTIIAKQKATSDILPNTNYHVAIQHDPAMGTFTLQVDGVTLFTLNGASATGTVGFQVKSTTGSIEDVLIH